MVNHNSIFTKIKIAIFQPLNAGLLQVCRGYVQARVHGEFEMAALMEKAANVKLTIALIIGIIVAVLQLKR